MVEGEDGQGGPRGDRWSRVSRGGDVRSKPSGWLEASTLAEEQAPSFCGTDDSGVF